MPQILFIKFEHKNATLSEELATCSEEMNHKTEQLRQLVAYFKLDDISFDQNIIKQTNAAEISPLQSNNIPLKKEEFEKTY